MITGALARMGNQSGGWSRRPGAVLSLRLGVFSLLVGRTALLLALGVLMMRVAGRRHGPVLIMIYDEVYVLI